MSIAFVCPQGHPLTAPENLAGKPGKCPHCGTKFLVPTLDEVAEAEQTPSTDGGAVPAESDAATVSRESAPAGALSPQRRVFAFYCPNGHKLNGPVSLKGKMGLCPHCQSRFRIPADDDADANSSAVHPPDQPSDDVSDSAKTTVRAAPSGSGKTSGSGKRASTSAVKNEPINIDEVPAGEIVDDDQLEPFAGAPDSAPLTTAPATDDIPLVEPLAAWEQPPPPPGTGHRLAELFTWIWTQRDPASIVELRLKDGRILTPRWFSPDLSQQAYGVFATEDDQGRYSMLLIAWDSVEQVTVQDLESVPDAWFN